MDNTDSKYRSESQKKDTSNKFQIDFFQRLVSKIQFTFGADPTAAPNIATSYQLVTLCRSICAEEKAQLLEPLMTS